MATSTVTETSRNKNNIPVPIPVPSRYEAQKSRDWYTFGQFLKNHSPPVSMSSCNGSHVIEFLGHLDHLGKTKVHTPICPYFGHPNPPAPCSCPIRQAWGSLDSLIGRLRAAYEEHGGSAETNPFAARAVQLYLREVREWQEKSRGIVKKREPNPLPLVLQPRPGVTVPALVPRYFKMDAVPLSAPAVVRVGAVPTPYPFRNRLPRGGSVNAGQGKGNSDKERALNTTTTATTNAAVTATVTAAVASSTTVAAAASATTTAATAVTSTAAVIAPTTTDAVVTTTTKRSSSDTQTLQNDRRTRVRRGNKK